MNNAYNERKLLGTIIMKKQDVAGIIVYVIILALAAVFGLLVIREYASRTDMEMGIFILYVIGAIVTGVIVNAIIYELSHMLGAKIGGYNITSVSILGFTFVKENGKVKFHFASYDGLTGETKIIPIKGRKKPSNPIPYLIMGTLMYAVEVVAVVFAFSLLTREGSSSVQNDVAYFLIIVMAVGGIIVFYNIVPFQLDSLTDGYRLRLVSGKKNIEAFNKMLLGEVEESGEEVEEGEAKPVATSFSADLKLNQVLNCLNDEKYEEAEQLLDTLIASADTDKKISSKTLFEAKAQKIFLVFVNKGVDAAKEYCDATLSLHDRKQLSEESSLTYLRAYILVSALLDRSRSECVRSLDKVYKAYKKTPENRRLLESKLFNKALGLVIEKHPDWALNDYLINIENQ